MRASSFKGVRINSWEEFYAKVNRELRAASSAIPRGKRRALYKAMLRAAFNALMEEIDNVSKALQMVIAEPFLNELYKGFVGEDPSASAARFKRKAKIARELYEMALMEMEEAEEGELKAIARGYIGRLLSLYKRDRKRVLALKKFVAEISKLPDIEGDYVVVIAGVPQVGKSTILSKLTSAKPEIGNYPFTTKTLIAGHIQVEPYGRIVLVDSPGLLEGPLEEKNIIEYKAVLAIKHLADHVLFVIDPSPNFYFSLREQLNVYKSVRGLLSEASASVVVNKIDLVSPEVLESVIDLVKRETGVEPIKVSALYGYGLDELKNEIISRFISKSRRP